MQEKILKSVVMLDVKKRSGQNMIEAAAKTRSIVDKTLKKCFSKEFKG